MLLPIVILVTVSAAAEDSESISLSFDPKFYFRKHSDSDSATVITNLVSLKNKVISFQVANKTLVYYSFAFIMSDESLTDDIMFKAGYTYNISYDMGFRSNVPYSHGFIDKIAVCSNVSEFTTFANDPIEYSNILDNYVSGLTYSYVFDDSSNIGTLNFIFNCTRDVSINEFTCISPLFFLYTENGDDSVDLYSIGFECEGFYDRDQLLYEDLVLQNQNQIKDSIVSGFEETNSNLSDIKDALTGDGDYNFTANDELDSMNQIQSELEYEILDQLFNNTITLPNGDTISSDNINYNDIYISIEQTYNAPVFEQEMAHQIDKIFNIFMPYLGTVLFLSLTLGLCIAFLTGRRLQ